MAVCCPEGERLEAAKAATLATYTAAIAYRVGGDYTSDAYNAALAADRAELEHSRTHDGDA